MSNIEDLLKKVRSSYRLGGYEKAMFWDSYLPHIQNQYTFLKNKKVVDFGCMAGATTAVISEYAKHVIGVEQQKHHYDAAVKYFGNSIDNCEFFHGNVIQFSDADYDFDCFCATNVLYHFDMKTIDAIESKILPKCDTCLVVSRENKLKDTSGLGLNHWKNIKMFLEKNNFSVDVLIDEDQKIYEPASNQTPTSKIDKKYEAGHTKEIYIPLLGRRLEH